MHFVSVNYATLAALPQGAKVGTSSQRRRAQLKALRPDIDAIEFRGNVDTRLRKLAEGQVDAILLASRVSSASAKPIGCASALIPATSAPLPARVLLALNPQRRFRHH